MATVLLVDDEPIMNRLVRQVLFPSHHVVAAEADGQAGLEAWRAYQPDVVVLDQMMPIMAGLEVARIMLSEQPDQAIILFTARADRELFHQAEAIGVAACVDKTDVLALAGVISIVTGEPTQPPAFGPSLITNR